MAEVTISRDVRIPTSDPNTTLSADVFRPAGDRPAPLLLTLTPYRKDVMGIGFERSMRWFAARGYACALVDLRGVGASDGLPRPKFDPGEGDDALAAIDWAAEQPWCDGNVGMWGASSGAFTTMRAASRRPAHLKAIIPMISGRDPERDSVHHDGARADLHQLALWGGQMLVQQLLPPLHDHASFPAQRRWQLRLHDVEPFILLLAREGLGDPVWAERAIDTSSIVTPTLCVGGWRDLYADAMAAVFEEVRGPKRLLVGPWMHAAPHESSFDAIDFLPIALRWWDHWLRGIDTGVMKEPPVTVYLQGAAPGWRAYDTWPPPHEPLVLRGRADRTLASASDGLPPGEVLVTYEPDPTTGGLSGLWGIPQSGFGLPVDQHDDDTRAATLDSAPLETDFLLCGRSEVRLKLADDTDAAPERVVVRLAAVDADDRSTFITLGVLCPTEPAEVYRVVLRATAYRVPAGSRLRIVVSDSDFPRLRPLAHPRPLSIVGVELTAPAVPDAAGAAIDVPIIAGPPPPRRHWTITRDHIDDSIDIAIGWSSQATTSEGHRVERKTALRAHTRRSAPEAAVFTGDHAAVVEFSDGTPVDVTAAVRCTQAWLWVRGTVRIDGTTVYTHTWDEPLGAGDA